jgi:hypothetical protein
MSCSAFMLIYYFMVLPLSQRTLSGGAASVNKHEVLGIAPGERLRFLQEMVMSSCKQIKGMNEPPLATIHRLPTQSIRVPAMGVNAGCALWGIAGVLLSIHRPTAGENKAPGIAILSLNLQGDDDAIVGTPHIVLGQVVEVSLARLRAKDPPIRGQVLPEIISHGRHVGIGAALVLEVDILLKVIDAVLGALKALQESDLATLHGKIGQAEQVVALSWHMLPLGILNLACWCNGLWNHNLV